MGTKLGNIHIKTSDTGKVLEALRDVSRNDKSNNWTGVLKDSVFSKLLNSAQSLNTFYLGEIKEGWISILHESFSWGQVKEFGEKLSHVIADPIITVGYFDDDVFELTILLEGNTLMEYSFCDEGIKEEYEIENKLMDRRIVLSILEISDADVLDQLLEIDIPEEAMEQLIAINGLPLYSKAEWLEDDEEEASKYTKYNLKDIAQ